MVTDKRIKNELTKQDMNTQFRKLVTIRLSVTWKFVFYLLLVTFIPFEIKAQQRFNAGIKAGLSTSQVAGDNYSGFDKAGFVGGAFVSGKLNEKWTGQFEIIYIQKGSKHNPDPEKGDYSYYYMGLDYIEVPVLFQYHQKKFIYELGPGFSYLMKEREYINGQDFTGLSPFIKTEINFNVGISYTIIKKLGISWRYTNSISPIRKHYSSVGSPFQGPAPGTTRWYNPGQMNNVLSFTLTYQFSGSKSE